MEKIKAKRKLNLGFIVSMSLLAVLIASFIFMNSRVVVDKNHLLDKAESYQKLMIEGLTIDPADAEKLTSIYENGTESTEDIEQVVTEIVENQWTKISSRIESYYLDDQTMENHKKAFGDLLSQAYLQQTYVYNYSKISKLNPSISWNLKNQVQTYAQWDAKLSAKINPEFKFLDLASDDEQGNTDYPFGFQGTEIWQKVGNDWKIVKANLFYPQEFAVDQIYDKYPVR